MTGPSATPRAVPCNLGFAASFVFGFVTTAVVIVGGVLVARRLLR